MVFPDINPKFSAGSMFAKDRPSADPNELQVKQVRVKILLARFHNFDLEYRSILQKVVSNSCGQEPVEGR